MHEIDTLSLKTCLLVGSDVSEVGSFSWGPMGGDGVCEADCIYSRKKMYKTNTHLIIANI